MKFGKTFLGHQVPEWQPHYMNYKSLKKQIKSINHKESQLLSTNPNVDVLNNSEIKNEMASFFFQLDQSIEKVDDFYNRKYSDYQRRLKKIMAMLNPENLFFEDEEESDEIIGILLELRNSFRNLKWFGELNRRAFRKILKKLDKKTGTQRQETYLSARVYPLSFSNESDILKDLSVINDYLTKLSTTSEMSKSTSEQSNDPYFNRFNGSSAASSISNVDLSTPNNFLPPPTSAFIPSMNKVLSERKQSPMDIYMESIKKDDDQGLNQALIKDHMSPVLAPLKLLLTLLNKATMNLSYKCIDELLEILPVLSDASDISGRNFIHHHVIALGKQYVNKQIQNNNSTSNNNSIPLAQTPNEFNFRLLSTFGPDGINSNDSSQGLLYIFEHLPPHLKFAILQKDSYRRTPLHYAGQYGLKQVTSIILEFLKKWGLYNDSVSLDNIKVWGDSENLSPIHLAILGTHPKTTEVLINAMNEDIESTCPNLLLIATRLNSPEILSLLLSRKGFSVDFMEDDSKETPLYIASKLNLVESVEFLLKKGANTEIGEATFGWTPIFVAAAEGFKAVIELLIKYGARYDLQDESGWSPREHAALRGHMEITELLTPPNYNPYDSLDINRSDAVSPSLSPEVKPYSLSDPAATSIDKLSDYSVSDSSPSNHHSNVIKHLKKTNSNKRSLSPAHSKTIKSFGHRSLKQNESLILITLGSADVRNTQMPIELNRVPITKAHTTELDTALSIKISAKNLNDEPPVQLDLPLDDNHGGATDPITFKCVNRDPLDTIIYFDVVPTYQSAEETKSPKILGRAVAVLRNVYTGVGSNKRSLTSSIILPILEYATLEVLGTIRFEFMLVTSFTHPKMTLDRTETYWKQLVSSRVIGHRGNGMNSKNRKSLQLGENTVESFIAAASLGASYVEFDVQLTKDDVPVVYHDFLVAESGIDIPMHALTLEQFMGLNNHQDLNDDLNAGFHRNSKDDYYLYKNSKPRSISYHEKLNGLTNQDSTKKHEISPSQERMKLTRTWKTKQYKGNTRGSSIASSFVTLVELFKKVPKNVGFNIECKYPMLDEAQQEDMDEIFPDMNHWVDIVLKTVYDNANGRDVIFSSFHPDICLMLSMKQPSIPILFLTEAGTAPMADVRACSLQSAIRFSKKWNLLGIVSSCDPIVACPRLASVVKTSGLVCVTYGTKNNDPENARLEMAAGVDAVIVDSVLAVRKELTRDTSGASSSATSSFSAGKKDDDKKGLISPVLEGVVQGSA